jgi:hypothetical protein
MTERMGHDKTTLCQSVSSNLDLGSAALLGKVAWQQRKHHEAGVPERDRIPRLEPHFISLVFSLRIFSTNIAFSPFFFSLFICLFLLSFFPLFSVFFLPRKKEGRVLRALMHQRQVGKSVAGERCQIQTVLERRQHGKNVRIGRAVLRASARKHKVQPAADVALGQHGQVSKLRQGHKLAHAQLHRLSRERKRKKEERMRKQNK